MARPTRHQVGSARRLRRATRRLKLETLEPRIALAGLDFGDAPTAGQSGFPSSYPTSAAQDGARHEAVGPQLGPTRLPTLDGQPSAGASVSFETAYYQEVGHGGKPIAVEIADFTGDGVPDAITANALTQDISIFPGSGEGTDPLQPPVHTSLHLVPDELIVADVNQDGKLDVVAANFLQRRVNVLLGRGDGSFETVRMYSFSKARTVVDIVLADVNSDGLQDIITANQGSRDVSVLLNAPNGSFSAPVFFALPSESLPSAIAAADLNDDSHADLVVTDLNYETVLVLLNDGSGSFPQVATYELAGALNPQDILTVDLDGDGSFDVVTANSTSGDIAVLMGPGDGTLAPAERYWVGGATNIRAAHVDSDEAIDLIVGDAIRVRLVRGQGDGTFRDVLAVATDEFRADSFAAGDLDADDDLDLVLANSLSSELAVVLGAGEAGFPVNDGLDIQHGDDPRAIITADFNADGFDDLATANAVSNDVTILFGQGDGSVEPPVYIPLPFANEPRAIAAGDVDGDGTADLLTANGGSDNVSILFGGTAGDFSSARMVGLAGGDQPVALALADLNRDGVLDFVTANFGSHDISLVISDGPRSFRRATRIALPDAVNPSGLVIADLNDDGLLDIAAANAGTHNVSILHGAGDGEFQYAATISLQPGSEPTSITSGDFNGDGKADLATANRKSNDVTILLGAGDGTFDPGLSVSVGRSPTSITTHDFNRDGVDDWATTDVDDKTISMAFGGPTIGQPVQFPVDSGKPNGLAIADLNNDGFGDLATANSAEDSVALLLGSDRLAYGEPLRYRTNSGDDPTGVAYGDLNEDTVPDMIVANVSSHELSLLIGYGDGTFAPPAVIDLQGALAPVVVRVGDLNTDGHADLVTANRDSNDVNVLLGNGDGTFASNVRIGLRGGVEPRDLLLVDLTQDGLLDVVTVNRESQNVSLLVGNADGSFQPSQNTEVNAGWFPSLASGDLNGDGRIDLVVANEYGSPMGVLKNEGNATFSVTTVDIDYGSADSVLEDMNADGSLDLVRLEDYGIVIREGLGDGTFAQGQRYEVGRGYEPVRLQVADMNGDGLPDVVTGNNESTGPSVLLGNSSGTLDAAITYPLPRGSGYADLELFDINGDGTLDVTMTGGGDRIHTWLGNGDGTLQSPASQVTSRGEGHEKMALGDVNGDGRVDMVTVHGDQNLFPAPAGANDIAVLLGTEDGFGPPRHFGLEGGWQPTDVALGDLDGDGMLDAVTGNINTRSISILMGNGDGTFRFQENIGLTERWALPRDVELVDLNDDSALDIVLAGGTEFAVTVLLGGGDGTFGPSSLVPMLEHHSPDVVVVADFNNDGQLDLATTTSQEDAVSVVLGLGDGSFQPAVSRSLPEGFSPQGLIAADFNRDGSLDLVVARYNGTRLLLGNGDGTFELGDLVGLSRSADPEHMAVGDVNGDGFVDLVTTDGRNDVNVSYGNGAGGFPTGREYSVVGAAGFELVDLDADGILDIIVLDSQNSRAVVLQGRERGEFTETDEFRVAAGKAAEAVALLDVNDDSILDVITASPTSNDLAIAIGRGDGTFGPASYQPLGADQEPFALAVADLNGDDLPDVVTANRGSNDLSLLLRSSGGGFHDPVAHQIAGVDQLVDFALADLNLDGEADAVVADLSGTIAIAVGAGDGSFSEPSTYAMPASIEHVRVQRINNDNLPDVIAWSGDSNEVFLLLTDASGSLQLAQTSVLDSAGRIRDLAVADFNDDELADIAVVDDEANAIVLLEGNGDGTFQLASRVELPPLLRPTLITAHDMDRDGMVDVVVTDDFTDKEFVLFAGADLSLQMPRELELGSGIADLAFADVNSDGFSDVVSADHEQGAYAVRLGNGDGSFRSYSIPSTSHGDSPIDATFGDVNGDGWLDVIVPHGGQAEMSVLLNSGDGSLLPPIRAVTAFPNGSIHVVDLNSDGLDDVVANVGAWNENTVLSLMSLGNGQLLSASVWASTHQEAAVLGLGDFNGDGHVDALRKILEFVEVGLGDGSGAFERGQVIHAGRRPDIITMADVNADGNVDALLGNVFTAGASLLLGNGDGTFRRGQDVDIPGAFYFGNRAILAGDVNGDGHIDVLILRSGEASFLSLGKGDGTFQAAVETVALPDFSSGLSTALRDADGDGHLDLILPRPNHLQVRLGNGDATFDDAVIVALPRNHEAVDVGDVNQDGVADFVSTESDQVVVLLSGSGVAFSASRAISIAAAGSDDEPAAGGEAVVHRYDFAQVVTPVWNGSADVNEDGFVDVISVNDSSDDITVFPGRGDGTFDEAVVSHVTVASMNDHILVHDFNLDGHLDLLIESPPRLMLGNGDGSFQPGPDSPLLASLRPASLTDMNADGILDVVAFESDAVAVIFRDESGAFSSDQRASTPEASVKDLIAADLNQDGYGDVVVAYYHDNFLSVMLGSSDGTFVMGQPITLDTASFYGWLDSADFNRDGIPDLVATDPNSTVWVLLGNGDGTFTQPPKLVANVGSRPHKTTVADINGDAVPDLLAFFGSSLPSLHYGHGDGTFLPHQHLLSGLALAPTFADFNQDGQKDLASVAGAPAVLRVLLGNRDDGITFPNNGNLFPGGSAAMRIDLQQADPTANYLDGWVDFNQDGDWDDFGEHVFDSINLGTVSGMVEARFTVPANALSGQTYARFRLSTAGNLQPTGEAADGEVEDYSIAIVGNDTPFDVAVDLGDASTPAGSIVVKEDGGRIVVTSGDWELFGVPLASASTITVIGADRDDSIRLDVPDAVLSRITVQGAGGYDTVALPNEAQVSRLAANLHGVEALDLRDGFGGALALGAFTALLSNETLRLTLDPGDTLQPQDGWTLQAPVIEDETFYRVVLQHGKRLLLESTAPWQNPIYPLDVNGSETVEPLDVLQIVNALHEGVFSSHATLPDPSGVAAGDYRYLDTNGDGYLSPLDALLIINQLIANPLQQPDAFAEAEGESTVNAAPSEPVRQEPVDPRWTSALVSPLPENTGLANTLGRATAATTSGDAWEELLDLLAADGGRDSSGTGDRAAH